MTFNQVVVGSIPTCLIKRRTAEKRYLKAFQRFFFFALASEKSEKTLKNIKKYTPKCDTRCDTLAPIPRVLDSSFPKNLHSFIKDPLLLDVSVNISRDVDRSVPHQSLCYADINPLRREIGTVCMPEIIGHE